MVWVLIQRGIRSPLLHLGRWMNPGPSLEAEAAKIDNKHANERPEL